MKKLILIGGGGHCKSVIDTIQSLDVYEIVGIIDVKEKVGQYINGIKIIDSDDNLNNYKSKGYSAFITIGSIGNVETRIRILEQLKNLKFKIPCIIDKTAIIANDASIGRGTFVGKRAIVNSSSEIGENCIINSGSIVEHNCEIGDFVHIAPGSIICGGAKVKENSHVGAGSVIIQYKNVGKNCIIGAGSVVINNVKDNKIAYGNPAREVRINE